MEYFAQHIIFWLAVRRLVMIPQKAMGTHVSPNTNAAG